MYGKLYPLNPIFIRNTGRHLCPAAIFVLLASISIATLSSAVLPTAATNSSELTTLVSENEDPAINEYDLAYFLVIHDFDAKPMSDHVEIRLNNTIYRLAPNGPYPGLANITVMS